MLFIVRSAVQLAEGGFTSFYCLKTLDEYVEEDGGLRDEPPG